MNISISKLSKDNASISDYKKEWSKEYYILYSVKVLISAFSAITAYLYLHSLIVPLSGGESSAHVLTILALLVLEIGAYFIFSKFSKMSVRGRLLNALILLPFALLLFASSFILSTNGIAALTTEKISNIAEITENKQIEESNIKALYTSQISELKESILIIRNNPSGWQGGRRSVLLREQLNQISDLNGKIYNLREKQAQNIKEIEAKFEALKRADNAQTTGTAKNYYLIVGIVQFLQLVASFIIAFMSTKIFKHDESRDFIIQDLTTLKENLFNTTIEAVRNQSKQLIGLVKEELTLSTLLSDKLPLSAFVPAPLEKQPTETKTDRKEGFDTELSKGSNKPHKIIRGFQMSNERNEYNERNRDTQDNQTVTEQKRKGWGTAICPNCNTTFTKNAHNQIYDTKLCRLEHKEKIKGYDLSRYKHNLKTN